MANRLKKVASVQYSAGSPAVAAVKGYTAWYRQVVPGYFEPVVRFETDVYGNTYWFVYSGAWVPETSYVYRVVVPSSPARPAVDPSFTYSALTGWNSGARSRQVLPGDGRIEFRVGPSPRGVVAGLTSQDTDTTPGDIEFGFYVHGTVAEIYEGGTSVYSVPAAVDTATKYAVSRAWGVLTYLVNDVVVYTSLRTSANPLMLDASLYSTGDFVDDPEFYLLTSYGGGGTNMPAYAVYGIQGTKANGMSKMPAYAVLGDAGLHGLGGVSMPAYLVSGSDFPYASGGSVLRAPTSIGDGGYPSLDVQSSMLYITPPVTFGYGTTGEIGSGNVVMPSYSGIGSDFPYSHGGSHPRAIEVRAHDSAEPGNIHTGSEALLLTDVYIGTSNQGIVFAEGLGLSDEYLIRVIDSAGYFDSLLLGNTIAVQQAINAVIMSALALGDSSAAPAVARKQYATNVLTSAVSPYANFDFKAFARCGQETYAVKQDGLYRIRPGDDDGTAIAASVNFGEPLVGSRTNLQHIEDMFFGVDTDGKLYAKLVVDKVEYVYEVQRRGELSRAVLARGLRGRSWNIELVIVDASTLDLEFMEIHTDAARRWSTK